MTSEILAPMTTSPIDTLAASICAHVQRCGGTADAAAARAIAEDALGQRNPGGVGVVYHGIQRDWGLESFTETPAQAPPHLRTPYQVRVERSGEQIWVIVAPAGLDMERLNVARAPMAAVCLEINEGLPCLHVTNDPVGDMIASIFLFEEGAIFVPHADRVRDISDVPSDSEAARRVIATKTMPGAGAFFFDSPIPPLELPAPETPEVTA